MTIAIPDGLHPDALKQLQEKGYNIVDTISGYEETIEILVVRSATKVTKDLIDSLPALKLVIRAGTGLDNIDVEYARQRGIIVKNTPGINARSVAELAFAHMLTLARNLHLSNREMPQKGHTHFKELKKKYSDGVELEGKTLGIIGAGRIGRELAKIAVGAGMKVVFSRKSEEPVEIEMTISNHKFVLSFPVMPIEELVGIADFVSIHIPAQKSPVITWDVLSKFKRGSFLINTSRGGVVDEHALLRAIDEGILKGAALDVFEGEPEPDPRVLNHPAVSLSPHIGASTVDAQKKIGIKVVEIIEEFAANN